MADRDAAHVVSDAVQAVRQAQQQLSVSAQVVDSTIAQESGYASLWAQLRALPSAATFAPLQSTRSWQVDMAQPTRQEAPASDVDRRPFVDALVQRARTQQSLATPSRSALSVASGGARLPSLGRAPSLVSSTLGQPSEHATTAEASLDSPRPEPAGEAPFQTQVTLVSPSSAESAVSLGSWAALERIADLVQALERQGAPEGQDQGALASPIRQEAPQAPGAPLAQPSARAPRSAPGSGPQQAQRVSPMVPSLSNAPAQVPQADRAPSPLEGLVRDWWSQDKAPERGSVRSERPDAPDGPLGSLAPRNPSMLEPRITPSSRLSSVSATTPVSANDNVAHGMTSGRLPQARGSASEPRLQDDEALAEQLNRALIEQAWRGGVDLT